MSVIASDGLYLLVGDGAESEGYEAFPGIEVKRFEITQLLVQDTALTTQGWATGVATGNRQLLLECQAVATSSSPAERVRNLALLGVEGRFTFLITGSQQVQFAGFVQQYREYISAGSLKRVQFRLESSGSILCV